ncbi:CYTH domain-containing protein [Alishewanella sp. 16-MA]|uniref:CYTH domain-containing protein n=1 Tax=Alishewanella maricola TaxID=2795740 RepID=A0ABS8C6B1_9ALTE|nr:CYTH domain-containing protein [Alishewanella maricola]MCB5227670.1 CYTH domain-containing protein [Alishewanella maricola]
MSLELELKYLISAADAALLPDLLQLYPILRTTEPQSLLNAYFDTAEHWFRQHDMGLRSRLKLGRFEQTLKLAGQQHGALQIRPEYNVPCHGVIPQLDQFPAEVWPVDTDISALQTQLVELFRTDFQRSSWVVQLPDAEIEVVYDNGEVRAGERRQAISEMELELLSGRPQALFELAEFLLKALPLRTGWLSKAARGYQLFHNKTTARPKPLAAQQAAQPLLVYLQRLQQLENCYLQELAPDLLSEVEDALQQLAHQLTDEGQQLLSSQARTAARELAESGALVFNSQAYHLLLLKVSALLLQDV